MADDALGKARTLLGELIGAARTGAIIPVRLTGQLEAIDALLAEALTPDAYAVSLRSTTAEQKDARPAPP